MIPFNSKKEIEDFQNCFNKCFKAKHDENLYGIIGLMWMKKKKHTLTLEQHRFIENTLKRFGMNDCNPSPHSSTVQTDWAKRYALRQQNATPWWKTNKPFRALVWSFLYIATQIRSDILFATISITTFCEQLEPRHWRAAKRILRHLCWD